MIIKSIGTKICFAIIVTSGIIAIALAGICDGNNNTKDPNEAGQKAGVAQPMGKPIIIWYYNVDRDTPVVIETAISSGLISHVMIKSIHRKDYDYKTWKKKPNIDKAIEIVKNSDAKLIWSRPVWPLYGIEQSSAEDLFDPNYYIQEIQALRAEGMEMGADFVALDMEPYANTPTKKYLRGSNKLTSGQREQLKRVIQQVVKTVGAIDFISPAGLMDETHPYNILSGLGQYRIAESTYYSNLNTIKSIKYPYEIFGAYVNTVKDNPGHPKAPFFTVREIFEKSHLWSDKKGLFLYPREGNSLAVARELVAYSKQLPFNDSKKEKNQNSIKR